MSIVFQKSGMSDLTLERGRILPKKNPIEINQERYLTQNNKPIVVNYGSSLNLIEVEFNYLSKDNYDGAVNGLKTWFEDTSINWSANNFTLVDELGESHTVRFWQDKFDMQQNVGGRYSIKFTLLEE